MRSRGHSPAFHSVDPERLPNNDLATSQLSPLSFFAPGQAFPLRALLCIKLWSTSHFLLHPSPAWCPCASCVDLRKLSPPSPTEAVEFSHLKTWQSLFKKAAMPVWRLEMVYSALKVSILLKLWSREFPSSDAQATRLWYVNSLFKRFHPYINFILPFNSVTQGAKGTYKSRVYELKRYQSWSDPLSRTSTLC